MSYKIAWVSEKNNLSGSLVRLEKLELKHGQVRVRVMRVGLCRTDIQQMKAPKKEGLILGHEGSGSVVESFSDKFCVGDGVMWFPYSAGPSSLCESDEILFDSNFKKENDIGRNQEWSSWGVDEDGVCAEEIVVPAASLIKKPLHWSWELAAYYEPVLAALAPFKGRESDLSNKKIGLCGEGRIAHLTERLIETHGGTAVRVGSNFTSKDQQLDGFIECSLPCPFEHFISLLRPSSFIVVKSRGAHQISIPSSLVVQKELTIRGCWYGESDAALVWMEANKIFLETLFGPVFPMSPEGLGAALEEEKKEKVKVFINPQKC